MVVLLLVDEFSASLLVLSGFVVSILPESLLLDSAGGAGVVFSIVVVVVVDELGVDGLMMTLGAGVVVGAGVSAGVSL